MSGITTHVLDTARGKPAAGVQVQLESANGDVLAQAVTDVDGRVRDLLNDPLQAGVYTLRFYTGEYYANAGVASFHPSIDITFAVHDPAQHYHVPLLLSPFGYTTYRGS